MLFFTMASPKLRSQTKISSDDERNEADTPLQLGKRSSSESQDVTPQKKKKITETDIRSPIKGIDIIQENKTILPGKKAQELSKECSHLEENASLLDGKEQTLEGGVCSSVKSIENDCPQNDDYGMSDSDNSVEEKKANPLPKENEIHVTESDVSFEMKSDSHIRNKKTDQSEVKDVLCKDDSKEDISPCHEDETLCSANYCCKEEDNFNTTTESVSEGSSDHQIKSFSKNLTDESNKVSTNAEPQEKSDPKENVFENNIETGSIKNLCEITNKTEELAVLNKSQTQAGMGLQQTFSNNTKPFQTTDKMEFKEKVCDNTIETGKISDCIKKKELVTNGTEGLEQEHLDNETECDKTTETGNINDLVEERELVTSGTGELKISDEVQTQPVISLKQDRSVKEQVEFKKSDCDNVMDIGIINEVVDERELVSNETDILKILGEAQIQAGISSEEDHSEKEKKEFKETFCDNTMESGRINNLAEKRELVTSETEELKISDEAQAQTGMSLEQEHLDKEKMEFKETVCDNTTGTGINDLVEEKEFITNETEELKISDEAQTQAGISLKQDHSDKEKEEFKKTDCDNIMEIEKINDIIDEKELLSNETDKLKILDEAQTQAGLSLEQDYSEKEKMEFKETFCDYNMETRNINDLVEGTELATNGTEILKISNEAQFQADMSFEQDHSDKEKVEFKITDCDNAMEISKINVLVEERELVSNETDILDEAQIQAGMSLEEYHLEKEKMEFKETCCNNTIETGKINDSVRETELVTNETEELKISDEAQIQAGMSLEQKHPDEEKMEFKETVCDNTTKTGNINDLVEERELVTNESEELKISDEAQIQAGMSLEKEHSDEEKMELKETVCVNTTETGNIKDLAEERELVSNETKELKILDEAKIQGGMSLKQDHSDKEKVEIKKTDCDNVMEIMKINELIDEKELVSNETDKLKILDDAQTLAGMSSEQNHSEKEKTELKVTFCENTTETGNNNDLVEGTELATNGTEGLKISDEAQIQAVMSLEQEHSNEEKMEFEETVCVNTTETGNINDLGEERELVINETKELKISDETQIKGGMSSEQDHSDKEKVEFKITDCDNAMEIGKINVLVEERELVSNETEELKSLNEGQSQAIQEQDHSGREEMEYKESFCENSMEIGNDCQEERESARNQTKESAIFDDCNSQGSITSEQKFLDKEEMEHKETVCENTIGTGDVIDCQEEMELDTNQPEHMDISDEEDNINHAIDENVIRSPQSPEREYFETRSYKLPAMDDPIWKNRLPPPPGCDSPPPSPPPLVSEPILPQYNVNSYLDTAEILKSATTTTSGQLEIEFDINHLPEFTVAYIIKKCVRENQIKTVSGATVCTRGQYIPPVSTLPVKHANGQKRLHLYIMGPSQQSLETALTCVKKLIAEGEEAEDIQAVSKN